MWLGVDSLSKAENQSNITGTTLRTIQSNITQFKDQLYSQNESLSISLAYRQLDLSKTKRVIKV